jgi:hypothetical protein
MIWRVLKALIMHRFLSSCYLLSVRFIYYVCYFWQTAVAFLMDSANRVIVSNDARKQSNVHCFHGRTDWVANWQLQVLTGHTLSTWDNDTANIPSHHTLTTSDVQGLRPPLTHWGLTAGTTAWLGHPPVLRGHHQQFRSSRYKGKVLPYICCRYCISGWGNLIVAAGMNLE